MCESLGLSPKGRSAVVRMRVLDHVRQRSRPEPWRAGQDHMAVLLTRLGYPDLAERLLESTVQLDAPARWIGLGQAQLAAGFLSQATKSFDLAARMGDASALLHRAEALAAGGQYDRAIQACESYLAAHPGDLRAIGMRADFLTRAGFADEGARILAAAADATRDLSGVSSAVGCAYLKAGRAEAAVGFFQDAMAADPRDVESRINCGVALLLIGRPREALEVLQEALTIDPNRAEATHNLGVVRSKLVQAEPAAAAIESAAKPSEPQPPSGDLPQVQKAPSKKPRKPRTPAGSSEPEDSTPRSSRGGPKASRRKKPKS
jgi:tetratricopeptide (TPR) repeat protein